MSFPVLAFNALAVRKLAARGLTPQDVRAMGGSSRSSWTRTPDDDARWHVRTGWDATAAQVSV